MPPQSRAQGDLTICGCYKVEWTLRAPRSSGGAVRPGPVTYARRRGQFQELYRGAHDDRGQEVSCTAVRASKIAGYGFKSCLALPCTCPALALPRWEDRQHAVSCHALDPAKSCQTHDGRLDRQTRQLQQDAAIARTLSGCFCGVPPKPIRVMHRGCLVIACLDVHVHQSSSICHASAMTALHDAHGILDAAQSLQHDVGASRNGPARPSSLASPLSSVQCIVRFSAQRTMQVPALQFGGNRSL